VSALEQQIGSQRMAGIVLTKNRTGSVNRGTARRLLRSLKPVPLPRQVQPMLCTLISEPFDDPDWIFEPKFDGQRILGRFDGRNVELLSRYGHDDALWFPEILGPLKEGLAKPALVDGEVVCLDEHGNSSFRILQQRFHLTNPQEIAERAEKFPAYFRLFDLLYTDRYDITPLPLAERKELLRDAVKWSERIRWTEFTPREGIRLFRDACRRGQEGIIGKRLESRYLPGRGRDWVKIKCLNRQEFVIGGFTEPKGSRVGLGALLVGYYEPDGRTLVYAGKVGTGFDRETLLDLRHRLERLEQPRSAFAKGEPPRGPDVHWVKPELVAEIGFTEWTQNGLLRQPRFEGLRLDKKPREVRREIPKDTHREVHPKP
jgi:bifunctional non-homologous end joining protein LigD